MNAQPLWEGLSVDKFYRENKEIYLQRFENGIKYFSDKKERLEVTKKLLHKSKKNVILNHLNDRFSPRIINRVRKNGKLEDNWKLEPNDRNAFHNFGDDGTTVPPKGLYPNAKYSHKNGQYEVIVNKNTGEIVTLPSNAGTFNYYPPGASKVSVASMHHMDYDVDPWMDFGSGRGDNTTYDSRRNNSGGLKYIFGEFGDPNYKAIDEFQRIDKEKNE